ncbi:unnamed protein product [Linum tenue]|uniref:Uncharacterized protein n=1 Tax=Linum tenue TaxID=586396 RepID=A0AAV0P657_9ROSI|nr:unnamed protein product [Linum tenue]
MVYFLHCGSVEGYATTNPGLQARSPDKILKYASCRMTFNI